MGRQQKLKQQRRIEQQEEEIRKKKRKKKISLILLLVLIGVAAGIVTLVIITRPEPNPVVAIETEKGTMIMELFPGAAPRTVENFVKLTQEGFYNGTTFHRVVPDFVIQGGDPLTKDDDPSNDGTGEPGYTFEDEINPRSLGVSEELIEILENQGYTFDYKLKSIPHTVGTVSMANSGPNTNGSQFFIITTKDQPDLDGRYTAFGKVIEGIAIVQEIEQGDVMERVYLVD